MVHEDEEGVRERGDRRGDTKAARRGRAYRSPGENREGKTRHNRDSHRVMREYERLCFEPIDARL